ncbi:hypothetical protein IWQ56_001730 [Coemansia nantahalensis]|nr:hypothetical protein IWQ56_001730 [Coemansia nantahalensis]
MRIFSGQCNHSWAPFSAHCESREIEFTNLNRLDVAYFTTHQEDGVSVRHRDGHPWKLRFPGLKYLDIKCTESICPLLEYAVLPPRMESISICMDTAAFQDSANVVLPAAKRLSLRIFMQSGDDPSGLSVIGRMLKSARGSEVLELQIGNNGLPMVPESITRTALTHLQVSAPTSVDAMLALIGELPCLLGLTLFSLDLSDVQVDISVPDADEDVVVDPLHALLKGLAINYDRARNSPDMAVAVVKYMLLRIPPLAVLYAAQAPRDPVLNFPPPDSARGWLVVLGSFLVLMIGVGSVNSYGVYMHEYTHNVFPTTPASTISWIGCMQGALPNLFGIAAGVLVERFDPRAVIALGSVVSGGALMAALSAQWMDRYRALATGIAVTGGSIGGLWLSFASRAMIEHLGWQWSLRITGLVTLVAGCAFSPLMARRVAVQPREHIIDFSAMRNMRFLLLFCATVCNGGGYFLPYYFQPSYAVVVLGKDNAWGANITSILNAGSIAGRLLIGFAADFTGPLNALLASIVISAIAVLAMWLPCKSIGLLIASALLYGFVSGSVVSLVPVVTADLFGVKRLPSILGLLFISYAIGTVVSSPVGGKLLDKYGHGTDYTWLIVYGGLFFVLSAVLLIVLRISMSTRIIYRV